MKPKLSIDEYGTKSWRLNNGKLHREDGPAIEWADGSKLWRVNGKLHRIDGPAVEYVDGYKAWWINGEVHREDGPAIEDADNSKEWYINDLLHREDGPAVEWPNGDKWWYLNGRQLFKRDFTSLDQIIKMQATELFTPQEIVKMRNEA